MTRTHVLPAGDYFISDPCYPFPNTGEKSELWNDVLEESDYFSKPVNLPNINIWVASTTYGDGTYYSTNGQHEFGVDSGTLGIMTKETVDFLGEDLDYLSTAGVFVTFDEDFEVSFSSGVFRFGDKITIDTNFNDEENDDEEDFEDREDEYDKWCEKHCDEIDDLINDEE